MKFGQLSVNIQKPEDKRGLKTDVINKLHCSRIGYCPGEVWIRLLPTCQRKNITIQFHIKFTKFCLNKAYFPLKKSALDVNKKVNIRVSELLIIVEKSFYGRSKTTYKCRITTAWAPVQWWLTLRWRKMNAHVCVHIIMYMLVGIVSYVGRKN